MAGNRIGDFSRFPFRAGKHYSGVQLQQGRVQLDSDWNTQVEISAHQLRTRTRDLIGESGAPASDPGFEIKADYALDFDGVDDNLQIGGEGCTTYGGPGGLTLRASVQPRSAGTLLIAVGREPSKNIKWQVQFLIDINQDGVVRLHRSDVRTPDLESTKKISFTTMTHLAVEVGDKGCRILFDDEEVGADDQGVHVPAGETCFVVGGGIGPKRAHPFLSCVLGEFSVSRGRYQGPEADQSKLQLGLWKFDCGSGDEVRDEESGGNQALLALGDDRPSWVLRAARIGAGRYYVDGLLCELETEVDYNEQPSHPGARLNLAEGMHLFYLDVWERSVSALEDPSLREPALGGPDTTTRSQIVPQVKCRPISGSGDVEKTGEIPKRWGEFTALSRRGRLAVKRDPSTVTLGNHLYRVEIHSAGVAGSATEGAPKASFKWSRVNASACWPIGAITVGSQAVELAGGEKHSAELDVEDWVEVLDDAAVLNGTAAVLYQVKGVDAATGQVSLDRPLRSGVGNDASLHPRLRRWDQRAGVADGEGAIDAACLEWIELEAGIKVKFECREGETYRAGDYWQIPARTLTQDVEWPREKKEPLFVAPHGVDHHYCPLAILAVDAAGFAVRDLRTIFNPLTEERFGQKQEDGKPVEIVGDLDVKGKVIAKQLDGDLVRHDSVGTSALSDWSVTASKLAREIGTVAVGSSVLGPKRDPGEGYEWTGSKVELEHAEPSWRSNPRARTEAEGRLHLAVSGDRLFLLAESGEFWQLDPLSNGWTPLKPLPERRSEFAVAGVGDKIYVLGGRQGGKDATHGRLAASTLEYDVKKEAWSSELAEMPTPRRRLAAAVDNGRLYALGGLRKLLWSEVSTSRVEVYDPGSDSWRRAPSMPAPRHDLGAAGLSSRVFALGGRRRFFFGFLGSMVTGSHQVLNPISGSWSRKNTDLPMARYGCTVVVVAGRLYVVAGEAPLGPAGEVDTYDPGADAWSRLPDLREAVDVAGAATLNGTLWVAGLAGPADRREIVVQGCPVASTFYVHRKLPAEDIRVAEGVED